MKMLGLVGVKSLIGALYSAHADLPLAQLPDKLSNGWMRFGGSSP